MNVLLRPLCWKRGHADLVELVFEAMPFGVLVCSRCGKPADDRVQLAYIKGLLDSGPVDPAGEETR